MALIEDNYGALQNITKDNVKSISDIYNSDGKFYFYIYYFHSESQRTFTFYKKDYNHNHDMTKRQCEILRNAMIDVLLDKDEKIIKPLTTINLKK